MITITLPWPERILSPNSRPHWAKLAKAKSEAKEAAYLATLAQRGAEWLTPKGDTRLIVVFCPPSRRKFDRDNALASCKAALDGIAQALGMDDHNFEPVTLWRGEPVNGGQVIFRIGE